MWIELTVFLYPPLPSTLPDCFTCQVTLSGNDIIVPAREVWHYLTGLQIEDRVDTTDEDAVWKSRDGKLTVFWFEQFNHADIFDSKGVQRGIATVLREQGVDENGLLHLV
jgi:hypothetical protein